MENAQRFGSEVTFPELYALMDHILAQKGLPLCIWGNHGIGKTEFVENYAKEKGWEFKYINPAQFEEMADFHGMPVVEKESNGQSRTVFASPKWVPTTEGPGILLLDDINRADERILRGLMQLLQKRELFSWKLPAGWKIVATANPDNGDYLVTGMDEAMMTRLLHFHVDFHVDAWTEWAAGAGINKKCISFVRSYPEVVNAGKTTPRTLVEFFRLIDPIEDWKASIHLVSNIAQSLLDPMTATTFSNFVKKEMDLFVGADEFLTLWDYADFQKKTGLENVDPENDVMDRLSLHADRVLKFMGRKRYKIKRQHKVNILKFLADEKIPADLRNKFRLELVRIKNPGVQRFTNSSEFSEQFISAI